MARRIFRELLSNGKPKCIVDGCNQPGQHTGVRRKDGSVVYRAQCSGHHALRYNMNGGYRIFKKKYCENIDGRLGFVCSTNIVDPCMIDVDHINHNHDDNRPANLQCCHNYKTRYFDRLTESTIRSYFSKNRIKCMLEGKSKVKTLTLI
jgi:hypothetical protein